MTFYVENETDIKFPFSVDETVLAVMQEVLDMEGCPYKAQINVLLTDDAGIQEYNAKYRNLDKPTDVLSFPNLDFETPGDFSMAEEHTADYFDPESGELLLGDIILSTDRIIGQAQEYGHSQRREFAFLVAHSMLHLCGYDHIEPEEAAVMEEKQKTALEHIGITREA